MRRIRIYFIIFLLSIFFSNNLIAKKDYFAGNPKKNSIRSFINILYTLHFSLIREMPKTQGNSLLSYYCFKNASLGSPEAGRFLILFNDEFGAHIEWITSLEGQTLIEKYKINGETLFKPITKSTLK